MKRDSDKDRSFYTKYLWRVTLVSVLLAGVYKKLTKTVQPKLVVTKVVTKEDHGFLVKPIKTRKKTPKVLSAFSRKPKKIVPAVFGIFLVGLFSILTQSTFEKYAHWFKASLTNYPATVFDGTVMPIEKVPNWSILTEAERKYSYDQLSASKLIPLPAYDLAAMKRGMEWKPNNEKDRNTYITYPVPFSGTYKLDAHELGGSHAGIDIKIPNNTPVRAFAAGRVLKIDNQPSGYGKHIVIEHQNVPALNNPNQKISLYSGYAHLNSFLVKEGDIVKKGQIIAKSGSTGMATAPHLHFQVDKESAPFFPYWPFSWQEVTSAGMSSYFDAVNKKLGQSSLLAHSVHPVQYALQYQNYLAPDTRIIAETVPVKPVTVVAVDEAQSAVIAQDVRTTPEVSTAFSVTNTEPLVVRESVNPAVITTQPKNSAPTQQTASSKNGRLEIQTPNEFIPGQTQIVTFVAENPNLVASAGIEVSSTLKNLATIEPSKLSTQDFKDGKAEVKITTDASHMFKIIATGNFGEVKSATIKSQPFADVSRDHPHAEAIAYTKQEGIFSGYDNGTFLPNGYLNRAQAVKILVEGNKLRLNNGASQKQLADVRASDWFHPYVATAVSRGLVTGYDDGSFRPDQQMNRAEFLKVALKAKGLEIKGLDGQPYLDTPEDSWFIDLFRFAKVQGLFEDSQYASPGQIITRSEAAYIIWKLRNM